MKIPLLTLARHKFVYVLLTLLFLALVYRDVLMTYFFFDIHAPDLAKFDGQAIKNDLLKSALDFRILQFNLGFYQSFIIPIIIVLLGFQYIELKNKVLRLSIGREVSYQGLKTKVDFASCKYPLFDIFSDCADNCNYNLFPWDFFSSWMEFSIF